LQATEVYFKLGIRFKNTNRTYLQTFTRNIFIYNSEQITRSKTIFSTYIHSKSCKLGRNFLCFRLLFSFNITFLIPTFIFWQIQILHISILFQKFAKFIRKDFLEQFFFGKMLKFLIQLVLILNQSLFRFCCQDFICIPKQLGATDFFTSWHLPVLEFFLYCLFNAAQLTFFLGIDNCHGNAFPSSTSGTPATMRITFYIFREVVIDNMGQVVHIQATRGNISRHQHF